MTSTSERSPLQTQAPNMAVQFLDRVRVSPDKEAFRYLDNGNWISATWQQTAERVEALAAGLLALGIKPQQRVGIASSTRYEWILADLAIMCAGAAATTVYPTTNAEDTAYILADSESRIVFAEDDGQVAKLTAHRAELPDVTKVVVLDGEADGDWLITLEDLAELGAKYLAEHPRAVRAAAEAISSDQLATLIYTSGTTGRPKGVRLRHEAWVYQGAAVCRAENPRRGRSAAALVADGALVREGAGQRAAGVRVRQRDRRPRRQNHREHRGGQTHVHGRRAPHLRKGACAASSPPSRPRAGSAPDCSIRRSTLAWRWTAADGQGSRCRCQCGCCTSCSTGWCSARSATPSAGGSGSSSPVRPR